MATASAVAHAGRKAGSDTQMTFAFRSKKPAGAKPTDGSRRPRKAARPRDGDGRRAGEGQHRVAEAMARQQREISVSEFFAKNSDTEISRCWRAMASATRCCPSPARRPSPSRGRAALRGRRLPSVGLAPAGFLLRKANVIWVSEPALRPACATAEAVAILAPRRSCACDFRTRHHTRVGSVMAIGRADDRTRPKVGGRRCR